MSKINNQQGVALIVFFSAVLAAGAVLLLSTLADNNNRISNQNSTTESLAQAKEALLSYAVNYYLSNLGIHGLLPCPEDKNSPLLDEGIQTANCASMHENSLGRLAWKSLDIRPLKDASGECLWYAVSGGFFRGPRSPMTNADTPGMFQIYNEQGVLEKGAMPEDRVVAVVIAPGLPLSNQNRLPASDLPCKVARGAVSASDYLDNYLGINNAIVDTVNTDTIDDFITSNRLKTNTALNDQIITITTNDIFNAIKKNNAQYKLKINTLADTFVTCLSNYANNSNLAFLTSSGSGSGGSGTGSTPSTCLNDCRDDCDADRNLCILSSPSGPGRAQCQRDRADCRRTCTSTCTSTGGSSSTAFNLPWPAPIDISGDFRVHANYTDSNVMTNTLGRFPFTTPASNTLTSSQDLTTDPACRLSIANDEYRLLWQNWKDHWFYITHTDYLPGTSSVQNSTACVGTNCLTVNTRSYASLLIFSDSKITTSPFNQLRQDPYIESNTIIGNLKTELTNYLEGTNATSSTSNTSLIFDDYTALPPADQARVNDRIYCINITSAGVTQGYTYNLNNDPVCN